ncbi:MAG: cytochrome c biogenesis protein CcdA [Elusimicrobiota bacterium]
MSAEGGHQASLVIAFLAGFASFISPCVLPLVPVYLTYITGATLEELQSSTPRRTVLAHAGCFIAGFTLVFMGLGASASALGGLLRSSQALMEAVGGLVLIVFGLWMTGLLKLAFLYKQAKFQFRNKPAGFAGSVLVGAAFAVGWTPCVGPVLASILVLAGREGETLKGAALLAAYSAGMALPFLLCAVAVDQMRTLLKRVGPALPVVEKTMGVLLVLIGILLATGRFGRLSGRLMGALALWGRGS